MTPLGRQALVGTARSSEGDGEAERRLLAEAGVRAVRARAGFLASPRSVEPAPADVRRACSEGAAEVLGQLLAGRHADVLPEALDGLDARGLRLPHHLLPLALRCGHPDRVLPVLDARGRWLAARHPDGGWVGEGAVLDEDALEALLDDRAAGTRRDAAHRLARMDTRLARDMVARARGLVAWDGSRVVVRDPAVDAAWERDTGHGRSSAGRGERAGWLVQTLTLVSPDALGLGGPEVVWAIPAEDLALAEGLARGALLFGASAWAGPLWAWWRRHASTGPQRALRDALLGLVDDVDPVVLTEPDPSETLEATRRPWSARFGEAFLVALRAQVAADGPPGWVRAARVGAVALPPSLFGDALAPWPASTGRRARAWRDAREAWVETIRVRIRLHERLGP